MIRKRWLRWIIAACLTPILLVLVVLLSSPLWLNQDLVKREVTKIILNATGGKAQFERINLHLLPFPGVVVSRLRFSLPGVVELETQSAAVDIRLLPLLFGNVYPHRVQILAPQVRVQLEEPKPSPQPQPPAKPFSLKDTEASVRGVLEQIEKAVPGLAAEIEAGRVELRIGQRPPLLVEQVNVRADVTASAVSAKVSCKSNLLERLAAELRLTSKDLSGEGHVEISGLQVAQLGPILGMQEGWPVHEAVVNAKLKWRLRGLSDAQADASIDAPKVALQFGKAHLELVGPAIEAAAQTKGASVELMLRRAALDSPRIAASARLAISETGGYALEAESSDVDLPTLQATADQLAPAVDFLQDFPVRFARGTVTTVKFSTQSATLGDLFDLKALRINGVVDNIDLSLPVLYNLKVYQASAVGSLEQGVVRAQNVQGRLEKSTGREGSFEMDLNPDVPPLRADLTVAVDLPEALAVAKRVLPDRQSQRLLNQVKQLEGSAVAHAVLGGDVNNVVPHVEVSAIKASARYEIVPFPIRIAGGELTYTNEALSVRALDGAIGQSTFSGVNARLGLSTPNVLTAQQGSALLALEELFRWAAAQQQFAKQLEGVKTVSGSLAVSVTRLELPLNKPDQARFQVSATPKNISIDAPRYGPQVQLNGGIIDVSEQSVSAKGVKASALDAALAVSGRTDDYRRGIDSVLASATGTVGFEAQKWIYARADIPRDLRLRGALTVSDFSVGWRRGAGVAARGSVNVAGGPVIGFSVRSIPKRLEVEKFTVRDDASDAIVDASVEGTHVRAHFKGRLAGTSIQHTFVEQPFSVGRLQGDFSVDGDWKHLRDSTRFGFLQATNIRLPPELPVPLTIEQLSIEGKKTELLVKSATVSSGESRVQISGSISFAGDNLVIDADVHGDTVVVPVAVAPPQVETKAAPKPDTQSADTSISAKLARLLRQLWELPVSGQIRVDIGRLRVGALEVSPLVATGYLQETVRDLRFQRAALCGITLSGNLAARRDSVETRLKLSARGAQLEQSIACLTNQRVQATGQVDLDGEFSGSGEPSTLLDNMRGTFAATARDGHINKADALDRVLKLVNLSEAVRGALPDLTKAGMDYKSARVQGRLEGRKISLHEVALDASAVTVAAHGNIDLATGSVDFDVLVAPFKVETSVLSYIPIIRKIFGGMLLAIPVHIGGTLDRPIVVPLGAQAVASRLVNIMGNTLRLPVDAINLTSPKASGTGQPSTASPSSR
jgi:hypothetical protein